jgi:hypothetical protein
MTSVRPLQTHFPMSSFGRKSGIAQIGVRFADQVLPSSAREIVQVITDGRCEYADGSDSADWTVLRCRLSYAISANCLSGIPRQTVR